MSDPRLSLTDRNVLGLAPHQIRPRVRDTELPGFFVLVGGFTKGFMIQADLRIDKQRTSIRMKVGEAGPRGEGQGQRAARTDRVGRRSPAAASRAAAEAGAVPTLREASHRFRASHLERKNRSPETVRGYTDHMERLFKDWLDDPLSRFGEAPPPARGPSRCDHPRQPSPTAPCAVFGPSTITQDLQGAAGREPFARGRPEPGEARDTAMGVADLPGWFAQLALIPNPVRREFHLIMLLTGCRPEALKCVRVEHLDLRQRVMHIPSAGRPGRRSRAAGCADRCAEERPRREAAKSASGRF